MGASLIFKASPAKKHKIEQLASMLAYSLL
jgi:hypothetical protein